MRTYKPITRNELLGVVHNFQDNTQRLLDTFKFAIPTVHSVHSIVQMSRFLSGIYCLSGPGVVDLFARNTLVTRSSYLAIELNAILPKLATVSMKTRNFLLMLSFLQQMSSPLSLDRY